MPRLLPDPDEELDSHNPLAVTVDDAVSPAECAALIARIDAAGPVAAPIDTGGGFALRPEVRNNTRAMFDDAALAARILDAVRAHVPPRLEHDWHLCGANERLRCYRYAPGQFFAPHTDGSFVRGPGERSLLTLLVFLNDCPAGGETRLLDLGIDVPPRTGRAVLFHHAMLHEGAPVRAGLKYVARTDVMYRHGRA